MQQSTTSKPFTGTGPQARDFTGKGQIFFALGVVCDSLGVLGIVGHFTVPGLQPAFAGALLVMAALLQLAIATRLSGWPARMPHTAIGLAYAALGLTFLGLGSTLPSSLPAFAAYGVLVAGGLRLLMAKRLWGTRMAPMTAAFGLASVALAAVLFLAPGAGAWLGVALAVELFVHAATYITIGVVLGLRPASKR